MDLSAAIEKNVEDALAEDLGSGDLTAALIPPSASASARIISREHAILCGTPWLERCFRKLDPAVNITWHVRDGDTINPDQVLCEIQGNARALLTAERPSLNFLQTLSAVATATHQYVEAIRGTCAVIMDTRKTIPGLRIAEKYAVRTGGGENQRVGLFDGVLIKENHIQASGGIAQAIRAAQQNSPGGVSIQIEVENLTELEQALEAHAMLILLDNFSLEMMREAVKINAGRAELEASGGITLENVRAIAETGVNRISIGGLTKHIKAVDLSMRFT
jgi:nicotinate-nucleotide pyrophosphorylase (carboxylating)